MTNSPTEERNDRNAYLLILQDQSIYAFQPRVDGTEQDVARFHVFSIHPDAYKCKTKIDCSLLQQVYLPYVMRTNEKGDCVATRTAQLVLRFEDTHLWVSFDGNRARGAFLDALTGCLDNALDYQHIELSELLDQEVGTAMYEFEKAIDSNNINALCKDGIRFLIYSTVQNAVSKFDESSHDRPAALTMLHDAKLLSQVAEEHDMRAWTLCTLGCAEHAISNTTVALNLLNDGLQQARKISHKALEYILLRCMADVFIARDDIEATRAVLTRAKDLVPSEVIEKELQSQIDSLGRLPFLPFVKSVESGGSKHSSFVNIQVVSPDRHGSGKLFQVNDIQHVNVIVGKIEYIISFQQDRTIEWLVAQVVKRHASDFPEQATSITGVALPGQTKPGRPTDTIVEVMGKHRVFQAIVASDLTQNVVPCAVCGKSIPLTDVEQHSDVCFVFCG